MARTNGKRYSIAGIYPNVGDGFMSFDLIFSTDFTGSVNSVPYDGSVAASQSFPYCGDKLEGARVVLTTGTVDLQGVLG